MVEIPWEEKVYRCEYCHQPVLGSDIQQGGCLCGSRRVRIATSITEAEMTALKERGYVYKPEYWMDEATALEKRRLEREVQQ
jgi:hypothetical protein